MKIKTFILACLLLSATVSPTPAGASIPSDPREEEMFGGDPEEPEVGPGDNERLPDEARIGSLDEPVPDDGDRDQLLLGKGASGGARVNQDLLDFDRLQLGGMLYLRYSASLTQGTLGDDRDRYTTLSNPSLLDVYMDVTPSDRVRAYIRGRLSHDPMGGTMAAYGLEQDKTKVLLDQMWLKFDLGRTVFLTLGKQPVRYGATRLWNPADIINSRRRAALTFFDERTGTTMIRAQIPYGSDGGNLSLMALLEDANAVAQVGGAARLEVVLGPVELGLGGAARKDQDHKLAADISAGVWDLDLTGEVGVALPWDPRSDLDYLEQVTLQTSVGLSWQVRYSDEDYLILGGEYFYNPDLYLPRENYRDAFMATILDPSASSFSFFYLGRHYAAAYVAAPTPFSLDYTTFTLTGVTNLSDSTWMTRFDMSTQVLSYLSVEAYVAGHFGDKGGEFRFGMEEMGIPYQLVDLGANVRINF